MKEYIVTFDTWWQEYRNMTFLSSTSETDVFFVMVLAGLVQRPA